jgi:hypothetical protein
MIGEASAIMTAMEAKGLHMLHPTHSKHCERNKRRLEAEKQQKWTLHHGLEASQRYTATHHMMEYPSNGYLISVKIHGTA